MREFEGSRTVYYEYQATLTVRFSRMGFFGIACLCSFAESPFWPFFTLQVGFVPFKSCKQTWIDNPVHSTACSAAQSTT